MLSSLLAAVVEVLDAFDRAKAALEQNDSELKERERKVTSFS